MEDNLELETPNTPEVPPFDPADIHDSDKVLRYIETHVKTSDKTTYSEARARASVEYREQRAYTDEEYQALVLKLTKEAIINTILALTNPERKKFKVKQYTDQEIVDILKSSVAERMQPQPPETE